MNEKRQTFSEMDVIAEMHTLLLPTGFNISASTAPFADRLLWTNLI